MASIKTIKILLIMSLSFFAITISGCSKVPEQTVTENDDKIENKVQEVELETEIKKEIKPQIEIKVPVEPEEEPEEIIKKVITIDPGHQKKGNYDKEPLKLRQKYLQGQLG